MIGFEKGKFVGCNDSSCVIAKPTGMHTNGGCRCDARALRMMIMRLRTKIEKLKKQQKRFDVV